MKTTKTDENGRVLAIIYETAYSKQNTKAYKEYAKIINPTEEQAEKFINKAEAQIEGKDDSVILADIIDEIKEYYPAYDPAKFKIKNIEFQEFDSPRWHGSGYFAYEVWVDLDIRRAFKQAHNKYYS